MHEISIARRRSRTSCTRNRSSGEGESGCARVPWHKVLDQIVVSRGLLMAAGLRLDPEGVNIYDAPRVGSATNRPPSIQRKTLKETSDHLPVTTILSC
jgi:hypothetical protein